MRLPCLIPSQNLYVCSIKINSRPSVPFAFNKEGFLLKKSIEFFPRDADLQLSAEKGLYEKTSGETILTIDQICDHLGIDESKKQNFLDDLKKEQEKP